ncbi:MAG: hypothetical protein ACE3NC_08635 [Candidatus Wallacebacter cryptica]|nr:hypothetical protein [Bacillota bacterium]
MRKIFPNDTVGPDVNLELLGAEKAEFLGSFKRDEEVCDYYLVTTGEEVFYYYVPRIQNENLNESSENTS